MKMFTLLLMFAVMQSSIAICSESDSAVLDLQVNKMQGLKPTVVFPAGDIKFGVGEDLFVIGKTETATCGLILQRTPENAEKVITVNGTQAFSFSEKAGALTESTDSIGSMSSSYWFKFEATDKLRIRCLVKNMGDLSVKDLTEMLAQRNIRLLIHVESEEAFGSKP